MRRFVEFGFTHAKIKIGSLDLAQDRKRIEAAAAQLPGGAAHSAGGRDRQLRRQDRPAAALMLAPFGLAWFEDICDPLAFETQASVTATYQAPIAAGEALFSFPEAKLLDRYGGLRRERDISDSTPSTAAGCRVSRRSTRLTARGWPRRAFWPHLFCLHVVAAFGLGGVEIDPPGSGPSAA